MAQPALRQGPFLLLRGLARAFPARLAGGCHIREQIGGMIEHLDLTERGPPRIVLGSPSLNLICRLSPETSQLLKLRGLPNEQRGSPSGAFSPGFGSSLSVPDRVLPRRSQHGMIIPHFN